MHPDEFARYREWGLERGFIEVASGPLVRSSYRADRILERNNLGLPTKPPSTIPIKMLRMMTIFADTALCSPTPRMPRRCTSCAPPTTPHWSRRTTEARPPLDHLH